MNDHKELVKLALNYARERQSAQTGFFHYCFQDTENKETIPLFENFCFVLALLRTHRTENVLEGKDILLKLLHFQNKEGGFPDYLHEYPRINRPICNLQFLFPLYQMYCHYGKILGPELKIAIEKLSHYLDQLELYSVQKYQKQSFDHAFFGKEKPLLPNTLSIEKEYGRALLGAQLSDDEIDLPWDEKAEEFLGAPFRTWMREFQPTLNHIDLLLKDNRKTEDPIILQAALFYPQKIKTHIPKQVSIKDYTWRCIHKSTFNFLVIDQYTPSETLTSGFHLFKLSFNNHTFVCQETKFKVESKIFKDSLILDFIYPEEKPTEKNRQGELNFFLNYLPKIDLFVHGNKATTFAINDPITFDQFKIYFSILEGDATLFGHIHRGNRPSQISPKVKANHEAFDWKIILRTVSRSKTLKVQLAINWN